MKLLRNIASVITNKFGVSAENKADDPTNVVFPIKADANIIQHVSALLDSKKYVAEFPVPDEYKDSNNQYSHARSPVIGNDITEPRITNCSYEYFGDKLISLGFSLFVKEAPLIKEGNINDAFNAPMLWESFTKLLGRYGIESEKDSDAKYGYYLPTNHRYIEVRVEDPAFDAAQNLIEFYTRTEITDPKDFLSRLDQEMSDIGYPAQKALGIELELIT